MDPITQGLLVRCGHRIAALLALPAALACAAAPELPRVPDAARPPPAAAVRVRLAFPASADLDLYVTGPSQETVYFANPRAADGGALDADHRCASDGEALETVLFPEALPGRYRIGIDFPERCDPGVDRVPFELAWELPGQTARRLRGEIGFGQLEVIVAEFSVSEPP